MYVAHLIRAQSSWDDTLHRIPYELELKSRKMNVARVFAEISNAHNSQLP